MAIHLSLEELEEEYKETLVIDKNNLDNEVVFQSYKYSEWIRVYARCRREMKEQERALKSIELKVGLHVRKNYEEYDLKKADIKEKIVEAIVLKDDRVKKQWHKYIEAEERYKIVEKVLAAWDQRKTMLRAEVDLWIREYYLKDSIDIQDATSDARKRLTERRKRNG